MDELDGATAAHWVDGRPVFNVVDWLSYWHKRRRLSLLAACEMVLAGLQAEPRAAMLLRPGCEPCVVPDGFGARLGVQVRSQRLVKRSSGRLVPLPGRTVVADGQPCQITGPAYALQLLKRQLLHELPRGKASPVVPGLGCGLGVTEESARRLWPALFASTAQPAHRLHAVPTAAERAEQWKTACEECKPPDGFRVPPEGCNRFRWQTEHRAELLRQFEALEAACGKQAPALAELHRRWGYAVPKSDAGGSLTKVLTRARKERQDRQPRRVVKAGR